MKTVIRMKRNYLIFSALLCVCLLVANTFWSGVAILTMFWGMLTHFATISPRWLEITRGEIIDIFNISSARFTSERNELRIVFHDKSVSIYSGARLTPEALVYFKALLEEVAICSICEQRKAHTALIPVDPSKRSYFVCAECELRWLREKFVDPKDMQHKNTFFKHVDECVRKNSEK